MSKLVVNSNPLPSSQPEVIMAKALELILKYQKKHNIKNRCVDNAQIFHDLMKEFNFKKCKCKVKAIICFGYDLQMGDYIFNMGHLIVNLIDDLWVDPSYEFQMIQDKIYIQNINDFADFQKRHTDSSTKMKGPLNSKKKAIKRFLAIHSISNDINNNKFCTTNLDYYNSVINYVQSGLINWKDPSNIDKTITSKAVFEFKKN